MIETLSRGTRKARKPHTCSMCGRTITPGEAYEFQNNIYDRQVYAWKECAHCVAMLKLITFPVYWYDDEGIGPEAVREYEPASIAEARLIIGWRGQWRRKDGTLREVPAVTEEAR